MKIILTRRSSDFHAQLEGDSGRWGRGLTPEAAIGDLIVSHNEVFGIVVADMSENARSGRK